MGRNVVGFTEGGLLEGVLERVRVVGIELLGVSEGILDDGDNVDVGLTDFDGPNVGILDRVVVGEREGKKIGKVVGIAVVFFVEDDGKFVGIAVVIVVEDVRDGESVLGRLLGLAVEGEGVGGLEDFVDGTEVGWRVAGIAVGIRDVEKVGLLVAGLEVVAGLLDVGFVEGSFEVGKNVVGRRLVG